MDSLRAVMGVCMIAPLTVDIDARLAELGRGLRDDDLEPFTRAMYEIGRQLTAT